MGCLLARLVHSVEVLLQRGEAATPQVAIGLEPGVDLGKGLRAQPVPTPLRILPYVDQPGVAEHLQVFGDGRLGQREFLDQFAHRPFAATEQIEDLAPAGFG